MLFSPYFISGIGQGATTGLLRKMALEDTLTKMQTQKDLSEQERQDMYNFYKQQMFPVVKDIVGNENTAGLLSNMFARTGNLPISPFLPQKPIVQKVKPGETLVKITPEGNAVPLFQSKKNSGIKVMNVDGTIAVLDSQGNLKRKYEIAKKRDKGNFSIVETKPYQAEDGNWYYDVMIVDKNTGAVRKASRKRTKEPGGSSIVKYGGVSYNKDLLNLAEKIVSKYFVPDYTGTITYNGEPLTPEEAAALKSMLLKDVYNKLLYTQQNKQPKDPGSFQQRSVFDLFK